MQKRILWATQMVLFISLTTSIFSGCSSKNEVQEYNKPAVYWYNKMIKQISNGQIDEADDTYTSLESEHRNSPLLPSAIMIIANAHMNDEAYQMANFYFDEYLKKFALKQDADYIRFLKIKSNFLAFKNEFREQELLTKTLIETDKFIKLYPHSQYIHVVKTIRSRLFMGKAIFDKEISDLYSRIDKPAAQTIYATKAKQSWEDLESIEPVDTPWYRAIFE
ncbi:MAG: outer membrane protein assembly factor BamD [Campylobacterota bacterium]|nr:outer membrane protein assembly factor BamD [Campylobacterota bacterium]